MAGETAAQAFAKVDWDDAVARLLPRARAILRKVGWAEGGGVRRGEMEAHELVNQAIDAFLSGQRAWVPGDGQDHVVRILAQTMRGLATHARSSARATRGAPMEALDRKEGPRGGSPEERALAEREIARVVGLVRGDEVLEPLVLAILEGHTKREDLATALGWPTNKVKDAREKLARRLSAMKLDDERDEARAS